MVPMLPKTARYNYRGGYWLLPTWVLPPTQVGTSIIITCQTGTQNGSEHRCAGVPSILHTKHRLIPRRGALVGARNKHIPRRGAPWSGRAKPTPDGAARG